MYTCLAALLVLPAALAQAPLGWTQLGGDAGHSGVATLSDAPLDVVRTYRLAEDGETISQLAATPYGPTGIARRLDPTATTCQLLRIADLDSGRVERFGAPHPCQAGARLLGYDATHDAILLEFDGVATDPILQSWDAATGDLRWRVGPEIVGAEPPGLFDELDWYLMAFAMDESAGETYVAFAQEGTGRHRIEAVSLADGTKRWSTTVPASLFSEGVLGPGAPAAAPFEVDDVTATPEGLVVTGELLNPPSVPGAALLPSSPSSPNTGVGIAWLDRNGTPVGAVAARQTQEDDVDTLRLPGSSNHAAASGSRAAALLDGNVLVIDPVNARPQVVPSPAPERVLGIRPGPAWSREALVVPFTTTLVVYPVGDTADPRLWPGFEGSTVNQVFLAPPGDAYVAVSRLTRDGLMGDLVRVDLATARTVDRLPLPLGGVPRVLPLGDGRVLAHAPDGSAALLAPASEALRPRVEVENLYPAAGEEFGLVATVDGQVRGLSVAWGDGVLDRATPGMRVAHAYEEPGRRVVRVSALWPDDRTGTAEVVVHVGGDPPVELTFLQRAFSPDNQEVTFFLLGLAATGVGGLVALRHRFRRRSRLHADLVRLDEIRALARTDPARAVLALAEHRATLQRDLAAGALDDGQFAALTAETARLLRSLRLRILGSVEGRLSPRTRDLLDAALEDGRVTAAEAADLLRALDGEALAPDERARMRALVEGWASLDGEGR